jgi:hypothetical protein
MKTVNLITIIVLFALDSCNTTEKSKTSTVTFGIYETFKINDIQASVMDSLKITN